MLPKCLFLCLDRRLEKVSHKYWKWHKERYIKYQISTPNLYLCNYYTYKMVLLSPLRWDASICKSVSNCPADSFSSSMRNPTLQDIQNLVYVFFPVFCCKYVSLPVRRVLIQTLPKLAFHILCCLIVFHLVCEGLKTALPCIGSRHVLFKDGKHK